MTRPESILIILGGSLGDLARAIVLPSSIKAQLPNCRITWLVDSTWIQFMELHAGIDRLIIFDRRNSVRSFFRTVRMLRQQQFDVCLDLQRILKSGVLSRLSGAPLRIGFAPANAKEFNHFFNNKYISVCDEKSVPKLEQYLDFLSALELERPAVLDFGIIKGTKAQDLSSVLPGAVEAAIGIVLSSSWESKNWTPEGYKDLLIQLLESPSDHLLLLGGKKDKALAERLTVQINNSKVIDLTGKTNLKQLAAVIQRCRLLIGPDSGPGHIAAALGVPAVTIFGPTFPDRVAPYNNRHLAVSIPVPCGPCLKKKCPGYGNVCTHNISAALVMEKVILHTE